MKRILPLVVMVALIAISLVFFPAEQVIDPAQAVSEPNPIPSYEVISVEPLEDGTILFRVGER